MPPHSANVRVYDIEVGLTSYFLEKKHNTKATTTKKDADLPTSKSIFRGVHPIRTAELCLMVLVHFRYANQIPDTG